MATSLCISSASSMTYPQPGFPSRAVSTNAHILRYDLLLQQSGADVEGRLGSVVQVGGENFIVEREGDHVLLTHPSWSLMGAGSTVAEAKSKLRAEGQSLADLMVDDDVDSLSEEANRLRLFVLSLT